MITRAAAISLGFVLAWPAYATDPPTVSTSTIEDASIEVHNAQCLDGVMSVIRQVQANGDTTTQLGYAIGDTCGDGRTIALGNGPVPNSVLTGRAKTSLRLIADTRTLPDLSAEGEPLIIDMTWEPTDGDFTFFRTTGRSLHDGVVARFSGFNSFRTAKTTGTLNLFVPTQAAIGDSEQTNISRTVKK